MKRDKLHRLSTKQLDKRLQTELRKEAPDEEVVLPILEILESREQKPQKHRSRIISIAAVAAVFVLLITAMPKKVGAENLFDVLVRWTSSILEFIDPGKSATYPDAPNEFTTEHPGLQQLYDKVIELGVTESVVPTWLPDGFALSDLKVSQAPRGNKIHGRFENGSNAILITYRISTDISPKVEKEEAGIELFEAGEVDHLIVDNDDGLSATWIVDGVECVMNANLPLEDVYLIIKSIYRSELS